jgi:hypothetical protein
MANHQAQAMEMWWYTCKKETCDETGAGEMHLFAYFNSVMQTYLIHSTSQNHEYCIEKLQILVHIVDPHSKCGPTLDSVQISNERMSITDKSIDKAVHHPSIQQNLSSIVYNHGLLEQQLDIDDLTQKVLGNVSQHRQEGQISRRQDCRDLPAVNLRSDSGRRILFHETDLSPHGKDGYHDGSTGTPTEKTGRFQNDFDRGLVHAGHGFSIVEEFSQRGRAWRNEIGGAAHNVVFVGLNGIERKNTTTVA